MKRRDFLQGVVGIAASAALPVQDTMPNSAGTGRPRLMPNYAR
jgi:hypothetical protein